MENEINTTASEAGADKVAEALSLLARERAKIEKRIDAYEAGEFEATHESLNPIGVQVACETLSDHMSPEVAAALAAESKALDEANARYDALEDSIDAVIAELTEQRADLVKQHAEKRKATNAGNMTKGFWPVYGGLFLCVIAVFATRGLGFGMPGAVVAGVLGYASGSYIFKYLANRFVKTDTAAIESASEELEAIRSEYDRVADEVNEKKDQLDLVERAEEAIDELQMFIQDTLDDFDEGDFDDEDFDDEEDED